jgi:hypothetical protein
LPIFIHPFVQPGLLSYLVISNAMRKVMRPSRGGDVLLARHGVLAVVNACPLEQDESQFHRDSLNRKTSPVSPRIMNASSGEFQQSSGGQRRMVKAAAGLLTVAVPPGVTP